MSRWLVYRFSPWLVFWSTLLFGSIWLLTESGLQWLLLMARPQFPPSLQVQAVEGSLLTGIRVHGLSWEEGETRIAVRSAAVGWRLRPLLQRRIHLEPVKLNGLSVTLPATPAEKTEESAAIRIPPLPDITLAGVELNDLRFRAGREPYQVIERIAFRASHKDQHLQLTLNEFRQPALPQMVGRLDAHLREAGVRINSLVVGLATGGTARVQGDLSFSSGLAFLSTVALDDFDPGFIAPDLPSALSGDFKVAVDVPANDSDGLSITATSLAIRGSWQGHDLQLSSPKLYWRQRQLAIEKLRLTHGSSVLSANGRVGDDIDLQLDVDIPDIAALSADFAGKARVNARLKGKTQSPVVSLNGRMENIRADKLQVDRAQWSGQVSMQAGLASNWSLTARGIDGVGLPVEKLELKLNGIPQALRGRLTANGADWQAQTAATANLKDLKAVRVAVTELELHYAGIENWVLDKAGIIRSTASGFTVTEHCLQGDVGRLCGQFDSQTARQSGRLSLQDYSLQKLLRHAGDPDTAVQGSLSVRADFNREQDAAPEITGQLRTTAIVIDGYRDGAELTLLELLPGEGSFRQGAQGLDARLNLAAADAPGLSARLVTDSAYNIEEGQLALALNDLEVVSLLSPEIVSITGAFRSEVLLAGNLLQQPSVQIDARIDDAELLLNTPQIELQQTALRVRGDLTRLNLIGATQSGGGVVSLNGDYDIREKSGGLRIRGSDFVAVNSELARVLISPNLRVAIQDSRVDIGGTVDIPVADIHPEDLPKAGSSYVAPSADQVILQDEGEARSAPMRLYSNIDVRLGKKVAFTGFGLKTGIDGELQIRVEPEKKPVANGMLSLVDGTYKAYGQDLTIERGRIIYSGGSVAVPGIDLRAYRKPSPEVTVGILVRGTAQKPEISLWSEPEMAQTDQLSWLILGRSAQAGSESDQASLQNATLALGLKGSDFLAKQVKGKLGLDEVTIGTRPGEQTNQAALVLGKYLNPRIYVSYGIGLFEPIYTFRMRYSISEKWTLQTESGVESSGDLVYTIER